MWSRKMEYILLSIKMKFPLLILLVVLTRTSEGKTAVEVEQVVRDPINPLAAVKRIIGLNVSHTSSETSQFEIHSSLQRLGVHLPDVSCKKLNCSRFQTDALTCINGQCTCVSPLCWVYHVETGSFWSETIFTCGQCGQLGSWCNESYTCNAPGTCWSDGYCHCPSGENYNGVCVLWDQNWVSKFTLTGFGILFLVAAALVCFHMYKNRPWNQPGFSCCGLCKKTGVSGARRGSCEKTPAFTVSNIYGSQICSFDSESLQASANTPSTSSSHQQASQTQSDTGRAESGSVASVETITTSFSDTSVPDPQGIVKLMSDDDSSLGACSLPMENDPILKENVNMHVASLSNSSGVGSESSSISSSSSCSHERCQLCLPKGISARPKSNFIPNRSVHSSSSPNVDKQNFLPLQENPTGILKCEDNSQGLKIESTHF